MKTPDFLHRSRGIRIAIGVGVAIIVALGLVVARSIPSALSVATSLQEASYHISNAAVHWERERVPGSAKIARSLTSAQNELARARERLDAQWYLRFIPGVSGTQRALELRIAGATAWIDGALTMASIGSEGVNLVATIGDASYASLSIAQQRDLLAWLVRSASVARTAVQQLDEGSMTLQSLSCPWVLRVATGDCGASSISGASDVIDRARARAESALDTIDFVIRLAGFNGPRSVLLLYLNNTEIRPGGGFLGTYGLATFEHGKLASFRTDDIYALDREVVGTQEIDPPEPFRRHGITTYWYLRDANWSPDFSVSSKSVLDFYERENGQGNPGLVVGITLSLAEDLLSFVGPVTVDGQYFDDETIADALEFEVEVGYVERGIPRPQRKDIIAPLSREVYDRLLLLPISRWGDVLRVLDRARQERHVMAFGSEEQDQKMFERYQLAGRVPDVEKGRDTLMVVDANLGALKTDPVVERSIAYTMTPSGDDFRGVLQLKYRNTGTFTWKTTRYRTYTRAYLPPGTKVLRVLGAQERDRSDAAGPVDIVSELGRVSVGAFLSIEPGAERTLLIEFTVDPSVADSIRAGSYTLEAVKQLGSTATPLSLNLNFGQPITRASPAEASESWGDTRYEVVSDLRSNRRFSVELSPSGR
jgi:hypothetical protein